MRKFTLILTFMFLGIVPNLLAQKVSFEDCAYMSTDDNNAMVWLASKSGNNHLIFTMLLSKDDSRYYIFLEGNLNGNGMKVEWKQYPDQIYSKEKDMYVGKGTVSASGTGVCDFLEKEQVVINGYDYGLRYKKATFELVDSKHGITTIIETKIEFGCLFSQTLITLSDYSLKTVEKLQEGDELLSYDLESQTFKTTTVTKLEVFDSPETQLNFTLIPLETEASLNNQSNNIHLQTTGGHLIYTTEGVKKAKALEVGDILVLENGERAYLQNINEVEVSSSEKVYNPLTNNQPYFANGVLVLPK